MILSENKHILKKLSITIREVCNGKCTVKSFFWSGIRKNLVMNVLVRNIFSSHCIVVMLALPSLDIRKISINIPRRVNCELCVSVRFLIQILILPLQTGFHFGMTVQFSLNLYQSKRVDSNNHRLDCSSSVCLSLNSVKGIGH